MGRWRAPAEQAAPYITAAGFRVLESESRALWGRRREVVIHLAAAAAEGDRSENAEYQYRKKELREIDRRIRYLERRMPQLKVVAAVPDDHARVYFGAQVDLQSSNGSQRSVRIVGSDEARPEIGAISMDSPLARRLLGRALDDEIAMNGAGDECEQMIIMHITYPDPTI